MLNFLKRIFLSYISKFGYNITKQEVIDNSNDPVCVTSQILNVDEVKVIVDGGASIGDTSIKFSKLFPFAKVHAFEPFPKFHEILKESCKNYKRIIPHSYALSNSAKSEILNVNTNEGTNSLLNTEVKKTHPYFDLLETRKTIQVECRTLDVLFTNETIDLLKLDLQGGEYDALQGAKYLLKENRIKFIICEVMFQKSYKNQRNGSELIMYLEEHGFKIFNFYQNHYHHGKLLQSDVILYHQTIEDKVELLQKKNFIPYSNFLRI